MATAAHNVSSVRNQSLARRLVKPALKGLTLLVILNEIRGLILAGPVFYALWQSGGTLWAIWLAFCSLAGIALSVAVPWWVARKLQGRPPRKLS